MGIDVSASRPPLTAPLQQQQQSPTVSADAAAAAAAAKGKGVLSDKKHAVLFSNLALIRGLRLLVCTAPSSVIMLMLMFTWCWWRADLNSRFLADVEKRIASWPLTPLAEQCIGDVFLVFSPFFKMYSQCQALEQ